MKIRSLVLSGGVLAIALTGAISPLCLGEQKLPAYSDSEAGKHVGDEVTVTGKVASVSKSAKGTVYLNFGDKFPRQTFAGVVFAKDADKVGDLSAFEGQTVALTGRIELSPDGKPQIIIKSPDQVMRADAATTPVPAATSEPVKPPVPMPAPVPSVPAPVIATAPTTPAIPAARPTPPPKVVETRRIALAPNWATAPQGGDMTRKDLAALFGSQITSGESSEAEPAILYPEVPYLAPLATARRNLNLDNTNPSRTKITTPGLPVASLTANAFTGIFPGGYTTLTLVTDSADQVVSVHLADETPRQRTAEITNTGGYHTYNFIAQRVKGAGQMVIKHEIVREGAPAGVVVVDSFLIDPNAPDPSAPPRTSTRSSKTSTTRQPRTGKILERSRWYVPNPLVSVILRSSGNR
jgi:hypothetical protein